MSESDALSIARRIAAERGWPWKEPVRIRRTRSGYWTVWTNCECRGCNIRIILDDSTGETKLAVFLPR